jgi:hypothetical protein
MEENPGAYAYRGVRDLYITLATSLFGGSSSTLSKTAGAADNINDAAKLVNKVENVADDVVKPSSQINPKDALPPTKNVEPTGKAVGAIDDGTSPLTPVGRKGAPLKIMDGTNPPSNIGGRDYTGHSLDQMQGRGLTPSVVENTIQSGQAIPGKIPGTTAYYDNINNVTVITDTGSGRVITAAPGRIKQ